MYKYFISYIKFFIKSNTVKQLLNNNEYYKNIETLLSNDNFVDEMLGETHFRFLPFYGSKNYYGYTNKDLMMSFINSVPEVPESLNIVNENENITNLFNICLLFSIWVKFVISLHEFIIHLIYGYLHYFSNKKLDSISFKEKIDNNDGGFHFERLLKGDTKFQSLNLNIIITLLDGVSCTKDLSEFREHFESKIDIDNIIEKNKKKQFKGFLGDFLKSYPIDFNYFKKDNNEITVSCRAFSGIYVNMTRNKPDS